MDQAFIMRYLRGGAPATPPGGDALYSPAVGNRYHSSGSNSGSSGHGRSMSPLAVMENAKVYGTRTPVKMMDEDVFVMDGVLVASASGGRVSRSAVSSASGGSSSNSASAASSSSLSPSAGNISAQKTDDSVAWDSFRHGRYASNLQFAHGKEDLYPARLSVRNRVEAYPYKPNTTGSISYGPNYQFPLQIMNEAAQTAKQTISPTRPEFLFPTPSFTISSESSSMNTTPITTPMNLGRTFIATKLERPSKSPASVNRPQNSRNLITTNTISDYWSPLDDNIGVALSSQTDKNPPRKDVDAHINNILYGPRPKKRLPVFTEFCSD